MKKILFIFGLIFLACITVYGQDYYYWAHGEKYQLEILSDKQYLLVNDAPKQSIAQSLGINQDKVAEVRQTSISNAILISPLSRQKNTINWTIVTERITQSKLDQEQNILYAAPFFEVNGKELGLSNYFYVKLKDGNDFKLLEQMAVENRVEIIGHDIYMPKWYVLSCDKFSKGNALDMANSFYESGQFEEAQPDLMEDNLASCTNDLLFNEQWHLNNTGQSGGSAGNDISICNAWDITMGCANITVAVLDNGLEFNHPDFDNISNVSFDTETGTSQSVVRGNHGVAVAGIIGATANNGIGVAGVAPDAQLISISNNLILAPLLSQRMSAGINFAWQNGADIINNSWGHNAIQNQGLINDAILNAVNFGRNGLGTIVVFASGNDNSNSISYPSNNANTISVGAINRQGNRANFSNYGTGLDLIAPGVDIRTTDREGANGYSGNDYAVVPGTSFAAPQVAGVAALILSVNPELTQQQVRNIIESTADKVGSYSYTMNAGEQTGLTWNNQMGYGRLNAQAAVQAALPTISGPNLVCSSPSTFTLNNPPPGATVSWSVSNSDIISISSPTNTQAEVQWNNSLGVFDNRGKVRVIATVNTDCGSFTVRSNEFWAGTPRMYVFDENFEKDYYGQSYQVPFNSGTQEIEFESDVIANYTWTAFPSNLVWTSHANKFSYLTTQSGNFTVSVSAQNACGTSNLFNSVQIGTSGGWLMVYPNPTEGELYLEWPEEELSKSMESSKTIETSSFEYQLSIRDKNGLQVYDNCHRSKKEVVDLKHLPKGHYLLTVEYKGEISNYRLVKE